MKQIKRKKKYILMEIFDTFFILIICFATLLSAMLMKGNAASGMRYIINPATFIITIAGLLLYFLYVLFQSNKELKAMIKKLFDKKI
jgi:protein-S-isoprenylcysteine O-methyltransferase Ste14